MKTRNCGNLTVSEIGMGCMGFSHGYGQIPSEEYSIEAIRKALDYGCDFLDTSPWPGCCTNIHVWCRYPAPRIRSGKTGWRT